MRFGGLIINSFSFPEQVDFKSPVPAVFKQLGIELLEQDIKNNDNFLQNIYKATAGYDAVVIAYPDSPYYSFRENERLLTNFRRYKCDFGFADNYPQGVVFEVIRREALPVMDNVRKQNQIAVNRAIFRNIIEIDVNMFDLENLYTDKQLRVFRLSFFADSLQNKYILDRIAALPAAKKYGRETDFPELADALLANRHLLRTLPKYYEFEVTTRGAGAYIYSPYYNLTRPETADLSLSDFKDILGQISSFTSNAVIGLNSYGHTLAHKQLLSMAEAVLQNGHNCLIESTPDQLDPAGREQLHSLLADAKLRIIFYLDAVDPELYKYIHPAGKDFKTAMENVEYFLLRRQHNTYVQAVKMKCNFDHLVEFHKYFSKFTGNIIIQKYNTFRDILPERRINPMQPLEKIDCWHLKREMFIKPDGNVPVCRQDIKGEHILGNLLKEDIHNIFSRGEEYFSRHINGWDYCQNCDEYYTYNF